MLKSAKIAIFNYVLFGVLFLIHLVQADFYAQTPNYDWKAHDVGKVYRLVTNSALWRARLNGYDDPFYCRFPPGSNEEHLGGFFTIGFGVGAITSTNDTLYSRLSGFEFMPSLEVWDTIWVAEDNDTIDVPYWPGYIGKSDQDFICHYSDDSTFTVTVGRDTIADTAVVVLHRPLYLDVIQRSYAWSFWPVDEMTIFQYSLIPTQFDLRNVYISFEFGGGVGIRLPYTLFQRRMHWDDDSFYDEEKHLGMLVDREGGYDGTAISPIGFKLFPPLNTANDSIQWSYADTLIKKSYIASRMYKFISSGEIRRYPFNTGYGIMSMGPFDMNLGDTLTFSVAELLGRGIAGVLAKDPLVEWLYSQDFHTPSPPPVPPLRIEPGNKEVVLKWNALPGQVNPETYTDPYRADSIKVPFEGYRVYKSTQSINGQWTLLAEFDIPDNGFASDYGLEREYTDFGLLNNFEYYYTVTAFSKEDTVVEFPSLETPLSLNAATVIPGTPPPPRVGKVAVVPNPYRGDFAYHKYDPSWERPTGNWSYWNETDRRIQFINLPEWCEIRIYTLAGDLVETLQHHNREQGFEDWNLTSRVGQAVSSGIYLFTVKDLKSGEVQKGKFVIIK